MSSNKVLKYLFPIIIGILSLASQIDAQDSKVNASAPSTVALGQAFNYTVSGDFSGEVALPQLKGLRLAGGPSRFTSQQSSYVNGRIESSKTVTFTYTFIATQEGDIVIPPSTINSGRKEIKTNELTIRVVKSVQETHSTDNASESGSGESSETVYIRQIPSKTTVYQGEQFVLSTKIFTQEALNISNFKAPGFDGFWRQDLEADNNSRQEKIKGSTYLTQVFKRDLLTAQKPGIVKIEAGDIECMIRKRVSQGRQNAFNDPFFNDSFFDRYENVAQGFKTNSVNITVNPLPSGAPEGFDGAVGSFGLKANIDKDKLKVNDAITLKVHISGSGNLDLLKPLKINFPPDLEVFDPKSVQNIKQSEAGSNGTLDYEYVLIPRHAGFFRISPVVFSWFDPSTAKYKTVKSSEFTFNVEKADGTDDSYITSPVLSGKQTQGGKEVLSLAGDIRFIRLTPPNLIRIGSSVFGTPLYVTAFVIPLLFLLALILLRRESIRRNADMNAVRNRKARKLAQKRLRNASLLLSSDKNGFYDEILKALWGYLSDKLGINVSDLSREKIGLELQNRNLDSDTLQSLWTLLDNCEMARYTSDLGGDKQEIYEQAITLISVLQDKIS
jgi:hypothetical protein